MTVVSKKMILRRPLPGQFERDVIRNHDDD